MENLHKEELEEIRKWLEWGDIKKACDKFHVPRVTASRMLRGKAHLQMAFIAELAKIALKNKSMVMRSVQALKDLKL